MPLCAGGLRCATDRSWHTVSPAGRVDGLIQFLLPNYVKEGKSSLVIAVGCTGGKHRSVTLANAIADRLSKTPYGCKVEHRDIEKDSKRKG